MAGSSLGLPSPYHFLEVLGEGSFGKVVKCLKKDTKNIVAVKIPKLINQSENEILMLKKLRQHNVDQSNFVRLFGSFQMNCGRALVFEVLDISIASYIVENGNAPMLLDDISTIVQQVANALVALKSVGVIHTDVKPDNIMLVDHQRQPFKIKLIDFGFAILRSEASELMCLQPVSIRSPEMILGLPFSEAIDMWSLGCVMATMISGRSMFPGRSEYESLQSIIEVLGQPANHLLEKGLRTQLYFKRTGLSSWGLMTPQEYWGPRRPRGHRTCGDLSLDDMKKMGREKRNKAEVVEHEQCMELMKAMLEMDQTDRITPSEVLTHPFIAKGHLNSHMNKGKGKKTNQKKTIKSVNVGPKTPPSPVPVGPAAAMCCLQTDSGPESDAGLQNPVDKKHVPSASDCEPPATSNMHPDHHSPSPTILPSGVIMGVPPLQMEEEGGAARVQAWQNNMPQQVSDSDMTAQIPGESTTCGDSRAEKRRSTSGGSSSGSRGSSAPAAPACLKSSSNIHAT